MIKPCPTGARDQTTAVAYILNFLPSAASPVVVVAEGGTRPRDRRHSILLCCVHGKFCRVRQPASEHPCYLRICWRASNHRIEIRWRNRRRAFVVSDPAVMLPVFIDVDACILTPLQPSLPWV